MPTDVRTVDANLICTPTGEHYVPDSVGKWYGKIYETPQVSDMPGVRSFQTIR